METDQDEILLHSDTKQRYVQSLFRMTYTPTFASSNTIFLIYNIWRIFLRNFHTFCMLPYQKEILIIIRCLYIIVFFVISRQAIRAEKKKERALSKMRKAMQKSAPILLEGVFRCEIKVMWFYAITGNVCFTIYLILLCYFHFT